MSQVAGQGFFGKLFDQIDPLSHDTVPLAPASLFYLMHPPRPALKLLFKSCLFFCACGLLCMGTRSSLSADMQVMQQFSEKAAHMHTKMRQHGHQRQRASV